MFDLTNEINVQIQKVNEIIEEVAVATNEQNQGIRQINQAMSQMSIVTQDNARIAEGNASSVESLMTQTSNMKNIVHDLIVLINSSENY